MRFLLLLTLAAAIPTLAMTLNTGTAPWSCVSAPQPCTVTDLGVLPNPVWVAASGGSHWIGPQTGAGDIDSEVGWAAGGYYVYELQLPAGLSSLPYSFEFAADNGAKVEIVDTAATAHLIIETPTPFDTALGTGFSPSVIASGTYSGIEAASIRVTVFNDTIPSGGAGGPSATGFFLSGSVDIPEPSTWMMFGIGAVAVSVASLRRRR